METKEDVLVKTKETIKSAPKEIVDVMLPKKYNVIFFNDNITPVDFVVRILIDIFYHDITSAKKLVNEIHNQGQSIVGTYDFEIAEQKTAEATMFSRNNQFPLVIKYKIVD